MRRWIYSQINEGGKGRETKEAEEKKSSDGDKAEGNKSESRDEQTDKEASAESSRQGQTIININDFEFAYNPDAYVDRKAPEGALPNDENDPSTKAVREASTYLRTTALTNLLSDVINGGIVMQDGAALKRFFHTRGINMRYLGLLAAQCKVEKLEVPERHIEYARQILALLVRALEREMVVRGIKHLLRHTLLNLELSEVSSCLAHVLNCLFGFAYNPEPVADTSLLPPSKRERSWTKFTPASLQQTVITEIARRYRYALAPSYFTTEFLKSQVLREVCLTSGLQLELRNYALEADQNISASAEGDVKVNGKAHRKAGSVAVEAQRANTFVPQDIAQIVPVVKDTPHKVS